MSNGRFPKNATKSSVLYLTRSDRRWTRPIHSACWGQSCQTTHGMDVRVAVCPMAARSESSGRPMAVSALRWSLPSSDSRCDGPSRRLPRERCEPGFEFPESLRRIARKSKEYQQGTLTVCEHRAGMARPRTVPKPETTKSNRFARPMEGRAKMNLPPSCDRTTADSVACPENAASGGVPGHFDHWLCERTEPAFFLVFRRIISFRR